MKNTLANPTTVSSLPDTLRFEYLPSITLLLVDSDTGTESTNIKKNLEERFKLFSINKKWMFRR